MPPKDSPAPRRGSSGPKSGGGAKGAGSSKGAGRTGGAKNSSDRSGRPGRPGSGSRPPVRDEGPRAAGPKQWGSLGRKGAGRLSDPEIDPRNAVGGAGRDTRPDPGNKKVSWERTDDVRKEASGAVSRGRAGSRPGDGPAEPHDLAPKERRGRAPRKAGAGTAGALAKDELVRALGTTRGTRASERLRDAAHAFERERFEESRSLLRPIAEAAPAASSVRELLGLTYYRLGKWNDAVRELEAFREQTRSAEQHPVLADCYRALKRHREVEALWDELRESSLSADLVTEGRIVMAGSLADQRKLKEAISLLERSQRMVKRPDVHHLRQAYVLADLYERAGDVARARELFRWVLLHEPDFADAADRVAALT